MSIHSDVSFQAGWKSVAPVIVAIVALGLTTPPASAGPLASADPSSSPFRPGVVLVGFRPGVSTEQQRVIERAAGAAGATRIGSPGSRARSLRAGRAVTTAPILLHVPATRVLAVARWLRRNRAVIYAEPDYLMQASAAPNDPAFGLQWGDSNSGQGIPTQNANEELAAAASGTPGADDGALKAWGITTGSPSIVIGEPDTGVELDHPDLAANIWSNPGGIGSCAAGTRGYNVVAKTCEPLDDDTFYGGHGSHVAGIMGAVGNNGAGVAGINWHTTILPVKWLNKEAGGSTSGLIEALQWLVQAKQKGVNVRVVNDSATFTGTAYSEALRNEIDILGANDILFVTAAGNGGEDNDTTPRFPCAYHRSNEICVTASNNLDQLPPWANYGAQTVDLAAPGVSIYSTLRNGSYGYLSGGSMASAQVSGAAALILSASPSLSTEQLKADILNNVDVLPSLSGRVASGGRLDVCKAIKGCPIQPPPSPPVVDPPAPPPPPVEAAPPVISVVKISPRSLVAAPSASATSHRGSSTGATVSYYDSAQALAVFTVIALVPGIKNSEHRCVVSTSMKPGRQLRGARCKSYVPLGSFIRQDRAGRNTFHFSGRIGKRKLPPGHYHLRVVPVFESRAGAPASVAFRVLR